MVGGGRSKTSGGSSAAVTCICSSDTVFFTAEEVIEDAVDTAVVEGRPENGFGGEWNGDERENGEERKNEEYEKEEEEEEEEEEEREDDEKGFYQFGNLETEDGEEEGEEGEDEGEEEEEERPKLAEGFYEIECVRKRRVRKGQFQYLIKWRGWPETANTWEPFDNLVSCSDIIDAFEESLRLGKHRSSRKRKRKSGVSTAQAKKKPQSSPAAATNNIPAGRVRFIEEPFVIPSLDDETNMGVINNVGATEQGDENESVTIPPQVEGKEQNEMDVNLSESKGVPVTSEGNVDELAVDIQQLETSEVIRLVHRQSKVDGEESVQAGRRIGARRRKPASVKRFKQKDAICVTNYAPQDVTKRNTRSRGIAGQQRDKNHVYKNKFSNINSTFAITEIIKPISYESSESNNMQDVSVTFMAMRSDGKEVMVDNKYLKAKNPLLLINFYERHLKYNAT